MAHGGMVEHQLSAARPANDVDFSSSPRRAIHQRNLRQRIQMNRSSRTAVAVPIRATRRNTTCDRKAGAGSVSPCHRRALVKRGGTGPANWGRPGDELYDYDYEVMDCDCTEPSAGEAPCDGVDFVYPCILQTVRSLCTASRLELEMLLAEGFGLSPDTVRDSGIFKKTDELYTVTYGSKIVACVFMKTIDLDGLKAIYLDSVSMADTPYPPLQSSRGGKALYVCSLTVSPQHRGLGIASRLLKLIKNKASKDRMLWIQLHVDEKGDMSHELLLSMYLQHGFIVGADASRTRLYGGFFEWPPHFLLQLRCFLDVGQYLLINDGNGQINYEKFVYDCIFEESLALLRCGQMHLEAFKYDLALISFRKALEVWRSARVYQGAVRSYKEALTTAKEALQRMVYRQREKARVEEIEKGTPVMGKVTWTGLLKRPPCRKWWWYDDDHDLDERDYREDERDYREQQRKRVGLGQTARGHQDEGRKKSRTRTRIGCKGRVLHLRPRRGGKNVGTRGVALDLRELLADRFC